MTRPLVSVVTWDASFRESFHWFGAMQTQAHEQAEFIWSEFYTPDDKAVEAANLDGRAKIISLSNNRENSWHLGKCINEGVKCAQGDWLFLTDGDIVVAPEFLDTALEEHHFNRSEVVYYRRYDEPEARSATDKLDIRHLQECGYLNNPTNFGACALLHRSVFEAVGGYEEHQAFCGAGISSLEFNVRLRNLGVGIRWSAIPTYHPWHENTGISNDPDEYDNLSRLSLRHNWLKPYAGIAQSWIVHCRDLELETRASIDQCNAYLAALPELVL